MLILFILNNIYAIFWMQGFLLYRVLYLQHFIMLHVGICSVCFEIWREVVLTAESNNFKKQSLLLLLYPVHRAVQTATVWSASPRKAQQSAGKTRCWARHRWCCVQRSSCSRCWSESLRCASAPCPLNGDWPSRSSSCPARGRHQVGDRCPLRCPARPNPGTPPTCTGLWTPHAPWIHRWSRQGQEQEPVPEPEPAMSMTLLSPLPPGSGSERSHRSSRTVSVLTCPPRYTINPSESRMHRETVKLLLWNESALHKHDVDQTAAMRHLVPDSQSGYREIRHKTFRDKGYAQSFTALHRVRQDARKRRA